ncbi:MULTISPECIES: hypothetical protein [unclassified Crossiella]|uniref:hypothetical protein n=1 Tax=unclassified Crossiella TaxID=2620835 RepID=UPI00200008E9|nr:MULTISPECIES: hypothetical protein [unclassified Crossiella]MCK2238376.1 hypothetical protein [Crossiella sp. S99.2]MCK2256416.1 hypothetical protein [Crossiella sp. S99.1]
MTLRLDLIPHADVLPEGGYSSTGGLRALRTPASRRGVLRGVALSALTLGTLSLTWGNRSAQAETGPGGLEGWDRNDCKDAYPQGYQEDKDTGGQFRNAAGACFGGEFRSSEYCANGWHRSGTFGAEVYATVSSSCSGKNAWKWRTPDGRVYRCSDGNLTVTRSGTTNTYFTICRALVR